MDIPNYAQNAITQQGQGQGGFGQSPFGQDGMTALTGLLGGLFGNSGSPYQDAMDQYKEWSDKAQNVQNPFLQAGQAGMGSYQDMLSKMSNPTDFMNHIMSQYQQSPFAQAQQQAGMHAAQNMGSASGLSGSTPLMQAAQQNAQNISSGDQNQWLQNALGINSQALGGYGNMMNMGANSANSLTNMYGHMGDQMGQAAYGKGAGQNQDLMNMIGGGAQLAMLLGGL